jgi:protoporphyrinogen oxidase
MAGFGAAYRLNDEGITPVMYEKNGSHGGLTTSIRYDSGYVFDMAPRISFTKDARIQDLFADSVDHQFQAVQINLNNYWRGYWPHSILSSFTCMVFRKTP